MVLTLSETGNYRVSCPAVLSHFFLLFLPPKKTEDIKPERTQQKELFLDLISHRIIEWFGLEGTLKIIESQPP